jgi:hypothetical protein
MIVHKGKFLTGVVLMAVFIVVLVIIFMPVFGGMNGLDYLDNLYNSISKGSANYLDKMKETAAPFDGTAIGVTLEIGDAERAEQTAALFNRSGALVNVSGTQLKVSGNLGRILSTALEDAESMYNNDGDTVAGRYGYDGRQALYNWWSVSKLLDKALKKQKLFKEASVIDLVSKKALETAYNYYGIEAQSIKDKVAIVIFSLVFYVVYTLWYGFAILFMFEGWGLRLEH